MQTFDAANVSQFERPTGLLGAVICGGASSRMGQDKATLPAPGGGTYWSIAVERLAPLCREIVLAGRNTVPADLQRTIDAFNLRTRGANSQAVQLRAIPDPTAYQGPLTGLLSALKHAENIAARSVLVTPVDMPNLSTGDLELLWFMSMQFPATPVIATFDNVHLEPLVAIYPTALIHDLQRLYESPDRSLNRWLKKTCHQTCKLPHRSSANMNSPSDMHPIELLAQQLLTVPNETVGLNDAVRRILQSPVVADRDSPAANVSAMDGYAIRKQDARAGGVLSVIGLSQPGCPPPECGNAIGVAIQIFTGAVVPAGFHLVVRREDVQELSESDVKTDSSDAVGKRVSVQQIRLGDVPFVEGLNIRFQGENAKTGSVVIPAGTQLHAGQIAAAANFGSSVLRVAAKVRVRIIVTGDELRSVEDSVQPWQLRDSNGPTLASLLSVEPWLSVTSTHRAADDYDQLVELIAQSFDENDAILLTGGVSMGDFDYVPKACIAAGATQVFHKLPIRPGKPIFGAVGPKGQLLLGLPGNPVSAAVGTVRFAKPLLRKLAGCDAWLPRQPQLTIADADAKTVPLTWFRLVQFAADGRCTLAQSQGSGDLVSMSASDGFVELPPNEHGPGPWPLWRWQD